MVNAKAAGKGKVTCIVVTPDGTEVEADVIQNEDGTFDIFYTAPAPGSYVIYVRFGGENIPKSPFRVMVRYSVVERIFSTHPGSQGEEGTNICYENAALYICLILCRRFGL